jgi:hypothetical protein
MRTAVSVGHCHGPDQDHRGEITITMTKVVGREALQEIATATRATNVEGWTRDDVLYL